MAFFSWPIPNVFTWNSHHDHIDTNNIFHQDSNRELKSNNYQNARRLSITFITPLFSYNLQKLPKDKSDNNIKKQTHTPSNLLFLLPTTWGFPKPPHAYHNQFSPLLNHKAKNKKEDARNQRILVHLTHALSMVDIHIQFFYFIVVWLVIIKLIKRLTYLLNACDVIIYPYSQCLFLCWYHFLVITCYLQKLNAICFYWENMVSKVRYRSISLAKRAMDSDLRRSFSADNRRWWCMVNPSRFFNSRFSIFIRFNWFVRFSACLFFLILDRLADSRFDFILLNFLSFVE